MGVSLYLVFRNQIGRPLWKFRLIILIIIFLIYLFIGALIHQHINSPVDIEIQKQIFEDFRNFNHKHKCINVHDLRDFTDLIVHANEYGILFGDDTDEITPSWEFGGETFFFTFTLLSTIGYGHLAPATKMGKIFCIFYLVIGVPMTMVLLNAVAERLEICVNPEDLNYRKNNSNQNKLEYKKSKNRTIYLKCFKFTIRKIYLKILLIGSILILFIYLIPSIIFTQLTEAKWNFVDSIYYIYTSITTIGFGMEIFYRRYFMNRKILNYYFKVTLCQEQNLPVVIDIIIDLL